MADEWDDNVEMPIPRNTSSFAEDGRTYGKGRGTKLNNNNNENWGVGSKSGYESFGTDANNEDTGFNSGRGGDFNSGGGGDFNSGGDSYSGGGGGGYDGERRHGRGGRGGGGGYRNRNDDGDDNGGDDNDSRPHRGRGGGRGGGGRGGFRNRDDDNNGYSGGGGGGGGFDDDDSRPSRSRGGGRGGRGGGRDRDDGDGNFGRGKRGFGDEGGEGGEDPDKPPPVTYVPPEISTDDSDLFSGVDVGINFDKYDEIEVKATGENVPPPVATFQNMGLRNLIIDNVVKSGYTKPTPVQKHAIPIILSGRDLMACAQTGSGKTAAFLLPIIHSLLESPTELKLIGGGCEPHCVIVSPTRELAEQIWRQALKFSKGSVIKCVCIYGGVSTMYQGNKVAGGCHILVATPGRLHDFVERRRITFASVRYVVLDEADRMLDMGFRSDMEKMMDHESMVPKGERQTLMFSATFGQSVQEIAANFLANDYLFLAVGIVGGVCADVTQSFHEVPKFEKRAKLKELIEREKISDLPRTLVFVEMKKTADFIAAFLSEHNFPTTSMHGDRMQQQREEALSDFRNGKMPILVATAVAARGLDIKNVAHVINYDMPKEIDEYVHRIGRTGRVGNRGKATTFFDPETDGEIVGDLVKILAQAGQDIPDWLMSRSGGGSFGPSRGDRFGGRDVRNFGNDGTYDSPSTQENTACNADPEEVW